MGVVTEVTYGLEPMSEARRKVGLELQAHGALINEYADAWYRAKYTWTSTNVLGVATMKSPTDLWAYHELLWKHRPTTVLETGTARGGSALGCLVKVGGPNLLEPAAMKKPVIFSRYMFNFKEISEAIIRVGGGAMVKDKEELFTKLDNLLSDKQLSESMGERAFKVITANSGATARTIDAIHGLILGK